MLQRESPGLVKGAARIAGFDLGASPRFATAANVSGVRSRTLIFSRRRDSLTIFARDERYGYGRKGGAWTGADRTVIAACRKALRAAKIPASEIATVSVASEHGAVAERLSEKEFRLEKPELLRKLARAERQVKGVPVWSSYAVVGLTKTGAVGVLEIHWPHISPAVLEEATLLVEVVKRGFKPRKLPGARLEAVEAGIIHSPAIGFFLDEVAVIRCSYAGNRPTLGRKPVLYLDRHGELVALPRAIKPAGPVEAGRASHA